MGSWIVHALSLNNKQVFQIELVDRPCVLFRIALHRALKRGGVPNRTQIFCLVLFTQYYHLHMLRESVSPVCRTVVTIYSRNSFKNLCSCVVAQTYRRVMSCPLYWTLSLLLDHPISALLKKEWSRAIKTLNLIGNKKIRNNLWTGYSDKGF